MRYSRAVTVLLSAAVLLTALLTGPASFDATDGGEFAVAGSRLETAHPPGYPLFLLLLRMESIALSPLYGHLRFINCVLGAVSAVLLVKALFRNGISPASSCAGGALFLFSAPVMSQLNSLEIYPLAITLTAAAILLRDTRLAGYSTGMALFGGHPVSLLNLPLMISSRKKLFYLLTALIPLSLMLYLPLRAPVSRIAHYGHPSTFQDFLTYFSMYSGSLHLPSGARLLNALSFMGPVTGAVFLVPAAAAGRFSVRQDLPIVLSLLFLSSYQLPDPAGQLWILLLPLAFRAAAGMDRLISLNRAFRWVLPLTVAASAVSGTIKADRSSDSIALRWTTDVMAEIPPGGVYRPVAHDVFYAAYATEILGFRKDIILSDPYGNYFELNVQPPVPCRIGSRTVHLSRGWSRMPDFQLSGLLFHPWDQLPEPEWESMAVFRFSGSSPDPMALDLAAEAWARRMIQTEDPALADSFYRRALELASTELTERRIEEISEL